MRELDQSMQTLDTQSQLNSTLGQNSTETNGNAINTSLALSLVTAIKADLEQVNSESLEKAIQLENWIKHLQAYQANVAVTTEQDCKHEREWLSSLATRMRQAANIDDVFRTCLIEIRKYLNVERALIYRFESEKQGTVIAESMVFGYTPSQSQALAAIAFGVENRHSYQQHQVIALNHTEETEPNHYQLQLLQNFQVKTSLSIPIRLEDQVWGLLVLHQCKSDRQWQEAEISLLYCVVTELTLVLQTEEFRSQMQKQVDLAQYLSKAIDKIRSSWKLNTIFNTTVKEVRQLLNADRVGVFRFYPGTGFDDGAIIVEDVALGYTSMLNVKIHDHCFGQDYAPYYAQGRVQAIADIHDGTLKDCHIEVLAQFQIRANLVVPLLKGNELWGLLCVHKCSEPRQWQVFEIESVKQIAALFSSALYLEDVQSQTEQLVKAAERERTVTKVIDKIRNLSNLDDIFKTTVLEVRKLLNVEQVTIYKFRPDYFGDFIVESESPGNRQLVGHCWEDTYVQEHQGGRFRNNEPFVVDDVYNASLADCHVEALENFGIKACAIVAINKGQKLWGLLSAFQNSAARHWEEGEVRLLTQMGSQLGMAIQRAEYLQQLQEKSDQIAKNAEQERAVAKIIDKIRNSSDINAIFKTTTQEVRKLLGVERIAIYKFRPDYFGDFIFESESGGWPKLVGSAWEDSCLKEQQGGRFRNNEPYVMDDIYNASLSDCHIETLEYFGVKASAVVGIMQGQKLIGLLSAFQHSTTRHWEESEVKLLTQISTQLGAAIQQAEYIEELRVQSQQLAKSLERGTSYSRLIHKLELSLIQENFSLEKLFQQALPEVRRQLQTDRVAIYRFNPDWSGEFVVEDVGSDWIKVVGTDLAKSKESHLQDVSSGRYRHVETRNFIPPHQNIYLQDEFQLQLLEQWGTSAYIVAPISKGDQLWGLLGAYQNDGPREWEQIDINLLSQVGVHIGLALFQAEYLDQLRSTAQQLAEAGTREKTAKEKLQQEVIQLLLAVRPALNGDLTVRAPVTETEVGTVADAYNNTLQRLRQIVKQVQIASRKVAETSLTNESAISDLATQAQQQYEALNQSLEHVQKMANSTLAVGTNAQQVEAAVQITNRTVRQGDAVMNRTVNGIMDIRETVAETSNRLTRLSESSQKVSKVVNMIRNFTTQTQILALNAAIEATRAGEYGRGFGVVADEVRTLARQSVEATTEIEQLVQNIQEGTSEVSIALEKSIQQVAQGTAMVQDVRQNLNAIAKATTQISQLVEGITQVTQVQTEQFQLVTQTMIDVAQIAHKSSDDSIKISSSFKDLLAMSQNLQTSADHFKVD